MQHVIERIKAGAMWDFHGGIHPAENKDQSSHTPIRHAGLPEALIIPLRQHAGPAGELLVKVGDRVLRGQPLTSWQGGRTVPVHASTSGTITAIGPHTVAHPSGLTDPCITLTPDGVDEWCERDARPDFWNLERSELLTRIQQAGIAGLGGAVFPTHSKLDGRGQRTEVLIVNGLECEPYITTDDRLMRDYASDIIEGIRVLRHLLKPKLCLIGIEDNKPEAIAALKGAIGEHDDDIMVRVTPTKYPSGGAKQTIEILTGRQVPKGGRAVDIGIMVLNVATVFAIKRAIVDGEPLLERLVTLTGERFSQPGNVWVRLGTPVRWLLRQFDLNPEPGQRVIMGGPMMGFTLPHAQVPVVKATNCLLAPSQRELPAPGPEQACIRCSACADACPANLLPQELYWYSRAKEYDKSEQLNLFDCIECGACAWVCPSEIPLVQYYKIAKDDIRETRAEAEKAERAKARFEAKQARFEREKAAREARHAQAAANRRQTMTDAAGEDPVAAALARIKAKSQAPTTAGALADGNPDNSAVIAAREARKREAEARRAAKQAQQPPHQEHAAAPEEAEQAGDPKKAAVAAALARAKAKKAAAEQAEATTPLPVPEPQEGAEDPKKAAVAAAIARAKAKKAAAEQAEATTPLPVPEPQEGAGDPKKAAVAAAVARAKAKKAAAEQAEATTPLPVPEPQEGAEDPKKAAVAAAIARAKAKKAAAEQAEGTTPLPGPEPQEGAGDPKKAAVAAAIARAKAKKAAAEQAEGTTPLPGPGPQEGAEDPKKAAVAAAIARAKAKKAAAEAAKIEITDSDKVGE
ncbi:electron transport complex subunit RsxC [Aeromonas schubertii]|uniref:Ion-translocating oxidoreductase complex subunit C n=2 Tax=Aeromonas schubertii TaxID=652 RepID=A0ABS7V7S8_9GAMM|nr:electron transport complex subunit RsxC [Aeromonas schubertii]MBZ6064978.1 electron transport complex subunit RsxC [Aeromonas schubertii]